MNGMKNRTIRQYLERGYNGSLVIKRDLDLTIINANLGALRIVFRFNDIQLFKHAKKMSETHTAKAIFDMSGSYTGFYWVRRAKND